jgi:hypothetical protein
MLDPFVPIVGYFVLPPPTSRPIRALRAANFVAAEDDFLPPFPRSPPLYDHDEDRPSYISSHSLSQSPGRDRPSSTRSVVQQGPLQEAEQEANKPSTSLTERQVTQTTQGDVYQETLQTPEHIMAPQKTEESLSNASASKSNDVEQSCDQPNSTSQIAPAGSVDNDNDEESNEDSQQEFASVSNSAELLEDPNLLRFEMLTVRNGHLPRLHQSQSDPTGLIVLRPVNSAEITADPIDVDQHVDLPPQPPSDYRGAHDESIQEPLQEEWVDGTSEPLDVDVGHGQVVRAASSAVLKTPFSGPMSDDEVTGGHFDEVEGLAASSSWQHEANDDETQQLLSDKVYSDEGPRISLLAVKSHTVEQTEPSISTVSDHASFHSWRGDGVDGSGADYREPGDVRGEVLSLAPKEPARPTPGRFPIDSATEDEVSLVAAHDCGRGDHGNKVTCSRISSERYPIDGYEGDFDSRRICVGAGQRRTQPDEPIQRDRSILRQVPKVFRKYRENKRNKQQSRATAEGVSSPTESVFRRRLSRAGWCLTAENDGDSPPRFGPNRTMPSYSFDGACDEDDTWSTMPAVNLNKALPPQPLLSQTITSGRTNTPSLSHSPDSKTRPSTTSASSPHPSRACSKKRFHQTTFELVRPEMADSRAPSPLYEVDSDRFLVGSKYDPLASPKQPDT